MQSELKLWGNSAAVRIPGKILKQANLDVSSAASITVKSGAIVVEAVKGPVRRGITYIDQTRWPAVAPR